MMSDILPILASKVYSNVISRGEPPDVYLTFDDGPDPRFTPRLLEILEGYEAKATFFLTGKKAEKHPDIVKSILRADHTIGNHGYKHRSFFFRSRKDILEDVNRSTGVISDITGCSPKLFRPPHGHITPWFLSFARDLDLNVVLWSLNAGDYLATPPTIIERRVAWRARSSDIVLLHDGVKYADNTLMAIPRILESLRQRDLYTGALNDKGACEIQSGNVDDS